MAKLKRNHQKSQASGGTVTKVGIFAAIIGALFFLFNRFSGASEAPTEGDEVIIEHTDKGDSESSDNIMPISEDLLPTSTTGEIIRRDHYALSYSEEHEQAEWVAYKLTKASLQVPNVKRTGDFRPDPKVRKASSSPRDYYATGYDRGHLAPAGDMAFSQRAMSETFYMSNISPQIRNFNGGIWRELEENVRDWAYRFNEVYVVTGPVLSSGIRERIGDNRVSVPESYFKVILDLREPELKAIGFIIPNEVSNHPISKYAITVDEVESITGIDFFGNLLNEQDEAELEATINPVLWDFDDQRYQKRLENWNKRK